MPRISIRTDAHAHMRSRTHAYAHVQRRCTHSHAYALKRARAITYALPHMQSHAYERANERARAHGYTHVNAGARVHVLRTYAYVARTHARPGMYACTQYVILRMRTLRSACTRVLVRLRTRIRTRTHACSGQKLTAPASPNLNTSPPLGT